MTREEAIEELKRDIHNAKVTHHLSEHYEMAIKALSAEPCEDYISRADAINALGYDISIESDRGLDEYKSVIKEMLCKIYDVQKANIEKLPPVTPKPKTDVLDKIRAEIALNAYPIVHGVNNRELGMTLYGILEIIDKYKAESEET